jgi:pimeloyl-ACP methyl ester carboxylesterase
VGTDYGGLLAIELTLRHGARSLTLLSTAAWLGWAPARLLALPGVQRLAYQRYGGSRWMRRAAQPPHRGRFLADVGGAIGDPELPDRMRATALGLDLARCASLPARLRRAGAPVRLVWGDRDRHYPLWGAQVLSVVLDAPLRVVGGSGHALPFEQPAATALAIEAGLRSAELTARAARGSRRARRR